MARAAIGHNEVCADSRRPHWETQAQKQRGRATGYAWTRQAFQEHVPVGVPRCKQTPTNVSDSPQTLPRPSTPRPSLITCPFRYFNDGKTVYREFPQRSYAFKKGVPEVVPRIRWYQFLHRLKPNQLDAGARMLQAGDISDIDEAGMQF